jgi:lysozyme
MAEPKVPLVVDMFSGEEMESCHVGTLEDFKKVHASGIRGVIHKATQGVRYTDKMYAQRRELARAAGLLWGAYHFGTSAPVAEQVDHFLEAVGDVGGTLVALDFEKNEPNPADSMSYEQARTFLRLVYERTGRRPVLYSGNRIKEALPKGGDPFIALHQLWVPQYGEHCTLPPGFARYFLHQYTGDGVGPGPHEVPGIKTRGLDLNVYSGSDLAADWAIKPSIALMRANIADPVVSPNDAADEPNEPHPVVATAKAAYVSPTTWSVGTIVAIISGAFEKAKDAIASLFQMGPSDLVSQAREILTPAQEAAQWFHINWASIELTVAGVVLLTILVRNVNNKKKLTAMAAGLASPLDSRGSSVVSNA